MVSGFFFVCFFFLFFIDNLFKLRFSCAFSKQKMNKVGILSNQCIVFFYLYFPRWGTWAHELGVVREVKGTNITRFQSHVTRCPLSLKIANGPSLKPSYLFRSCVQTNSSGCLIASNEGRTFIKSRSIKETHNLPRSQETIYQDVSRTLWDISFQNLHQNTHI